MEQYKVIPKLRKGRVLTPAHFGCLEGIPTLNITNGCLFRCTYCYAVNAVKREASAYANPKEVKRLRRTGKVLNTRKQKSPFPI